MRIVQPHTINAYDDEKVAIAAFQAFLKISEKWQLKQEQQRILLGHIPKSTYHLWKNHIENSHEFKLPKDTLERISYLLGIYKNLHTLLPNSESANQWIHKPNTATLFNGQTALDKMLAGNVLDLADVRRFLDSERGAYY